MLTRKTRYPCIDSVLIEMMNRGLRYMFILLASSLNVPCREKTCLRGFRQSEFQTSLLNYSDYS